MRVISGKEKKIRETLLFELAEAGMKDDVTDILVPSENIVEMKEGKKKVRNKVFFPGYILIQMNMSKESRFMVENVNGVISFVGPQNGLPQPLKPEEITRILGNVEGGEGKEVMAHPFKQGDTVKVIDGPFMDFNGWVKEVNSEKQKVKVEVSIFGRPTPIELDFLQVELDK